MRIGARMSAERNQTTSSFESDTRFGPSIQADLLPESEALFFFFGGISGNLAMPTFEFYKTAGVLDCKKVFVRDLSQSWYHGDGREHRTVAQTLDVIGEIVAETRTEELHFVGNSMGGFAAILFACLLGRGRALAFAPQTFVSPVLKLRHRDFRWRSQTMRVWWRGLGGGRHWDLVPILANAPASVSVDIYASKDDALDMVHARRISSDPKVSLVEVDEGGHRLVASLRDQGLLAGVLRG